MQFYLTDHDAVAGAREAPISNQRHRGREPLTYQGCARAEHLRHARRTLRTLVPNDEDVSSDKLTALDRVIYVKQVSQASSEQQAHDARDGRSRCVHTSIQSARRQELEVAVDYSQAATSPSKTFAGPLNS